MTRNPSLQPSDPLDAVRDQLRRSLAAHGVLDTVSHALGAPVSPDAPDAREGWQQLQATIEAQARVEPRGRRATSRTHGRSSVRVAVAGVLGIAFVAILGRAAMSRWSHPVAESREVARYATRAGQTSTVELTDGSVMVLAPETRARVHENRSGGRTVELEGQALFTVTHDPRNAFVVRTGTVTTRVLGTEFVVRKYDSDRTVSVAVLSGKITSGGRQTVTLTAGMTGQITDSSAVAEQSADIAAYTAWTRGELVFDDALVMSVLSTLGRWYGYEFRLSDSTLAKRRVTVSFQANNREETLGALRDVLGVTMTFDDSVVTLRPRRGSALAPVRRPVRDFLPTSTHVGK